MIQKLRDVIHVNLFVSLSCEILKLDVFVFAQDKRNKGAISEIETHCLYLLDDFSQPKLIPVLILYFLNLFNDE
jgi:hypothetical protein